MKFFAITTLTAAALTLAACSETKNDDTVVPVDESAAATLNDDGSLTTQVVK